jgi:hypothetical protein
MKNLINDLKNVNQDNKKMKFTTVLTANEEIDKFRKYMQNLLTMERFHNQILTSARLAENTVVDVKKDTDKPKDQNASQNDFASNKLDGKQESDIEQDNQEKIKDKEKVDEKQEDDITKDDQQKIKEKEKVL